ncbi:unnamed protein product [Prunus armeniaca]
MFKRLTPQYFKAYASYSATKNASPIRLTFENIAYDTKGVGAIWYWRLSAGVAVDPIKVQCIEEWPKPTTIKGLRGFLGLAGYYRKSRSAFLNLKDAFMTTHVLALPDFSELFVVACDTSNVGIGAILYKDKHPIAYMSKALSDKHKSLSMYDKGMMSVVFAVQHSRPYLIGRHFKISTNHQNIKYFLEQQITSPTQEKWLLKFLGYDYEIDYFFGTQNAGPDALSRKLELLAIMGLSTPIFDSVSQIKADCLIDTKVMNIMQALQAQAPTKPHFSWQNNCLFYKTKYMFPILQSGGIKLWRSSTTLQQLAILDSYEHMSALQGWSGLKKQVKHFVASCHVCQRHEYEALHPQGLLHPLSILKLHGKTSGKNCILVVVDRLSKYGHFIPVKHPYTASQISQVFIREVLCLHGMPHSIISDRDPVFISHFWKAYFIAQGTKL